MPARPSEWAVTRPAARGGRADPAARTRTEFLEGDDQITMSRRVEVHDATHVELKLDYGLPDGGRRARYQVCIFAFFPGSLNIHPLSYTKRDFYRDINAYVRFKTPDLSLDELLDLDGDSSPLARLERLRRTVTNPREGARPDSLWEDEVLEEAKLFGCLARSYMRDKQRRLDEFMRVAVQDTAGFYDRDRLLDGNRRFLGKADALLTEYRRVVQDFLRAQLTLSKRVRAGLCDVDEYLSHEFERTFCVLLEQCQQHDEVLAERLREDVLEALRAERVHRVENQYHPGPQEGAAAEVFVHRSRLLKKFVSSALYLGVRRSIPEQRYADWVGALAAGLAMLFATLAAYFLDANVARTVDVQILVLIVGIYIFKDRIKELVKRNFKRTGLWIFPDVESILYDPGSGRRIGTIRETTRWVSTDALPEVVEKVRRFQSMTHRELRAATGETVLRYDKAVTLRTEDIRETHTRRGDVNDILRIRLDQFLRHTDDAKIPLRTLSEDGEDLVTLRGRKAYSINLIVRYQAKGEEAYVEKIRILLDRKGVKAVQTVLPPCPERDLRNIGSNRAVEEWARTTMA